MNELISIKFLGTPHYRATPNSAAEQTCQRVYVASKMKLCVGSEVGVAA